MSAEWGLLPAGIDETDLVMMLLALLILLLLVIAMFIVFHWYYALLGTLVIILGILYGVRELKQKEELIDN
jgi:1,4-dihydroxy-2-naphthoate octaprenyltransferase